MTFLPVVERELRVAARRRAAHWWRVGACLLVFSVMAWLAWVAGETFFAPQRSGRALFTVLSAVIFALCLGVGGALTADCLSSEKREGTLGLLFLTDLRGYDVVLGKLAATSLAAFYALLAALPVLALALLLGGLSRLALVGTAVCLLNTIFFSLTAGLFVSAISRDERRANSATAALILGIAFGLPLLGAGIEELTGWTGRRGLGEALAMPSPIYGFAVGMDRLVNVSGPGAPSTAQFWFCQFWVQAQSWGFLLLACAILPRTWHETGASGPESGGWRAVCHRWWFGGTERRRELRQKLLALSPVLWLTHRHRPRVRAPWVLLAIAGVLWVAGSLWLGVDWNTTMVAVSFALGLHTLFKYQVAAEAVRRFAEDRRSGALELLLSTPLTPAEIVRGQWLALRRIFAAPLGAMLLADLLLLATAWRDAGGEAGALAWVFAVGMAVAALDCVTLGWLGMWQGLRARTYTVGLGVTLGWVLALPWALWCFGAFTAIAFEARGHDTNPFTLFLASWLVVAILTDLFALYWARTRLARHFAAEAVGLRRKKLS
jgi:ABC-type transport system involved in multi-copper enzyme maturation permease subunit